MLGYVRRHWHGQQSLAWSFWFNLVAIRSLVFFLQNTLAPDEGTDYLALRGIVLAAVVVFHAILLVWQVVGVVRAADTHFSEHGNMALVWGAQLGAVLMLVLSAVYALGAVQMTIPVPEEADVFAQMEEEHARQYSLRRSEDGRSILINGTIELGITRAVKGFLLENPKIDTVMLESSGGNIYEGRGLAKVIADNALNTHVDKSCASACIIVFAGGKMRSAEASSSFGFHQYRVNADYTIIATDVEKEQRKDEQLLLDAGISKAFVDRVFTHESASMWWPELQDLLNANFLHQITSIVPSD